MEAIVDEALGDVEGVDVGGLRDDALGHEFVHVVALVRDGIDVLHLALEVVGVEDGHFADLAQALGAQHADVGVGAHQDAKVAVKGLDAADALLRGGKVEADAIHANILIATIAAATTSTIGIVAVAQLYDGAGQEGGQGFGYAHGAHTRTAAAVGRGEGLVQVVVHHVKAQLSGLGDAQEGVKVGPITVHQPSTIVN